MPFENSPLFSPLEIEAQRRVLSLTFWTATGSIGIGSVSVAAPAGRAFQLPPSNTRPIIVAACRRDCVAVLASGRSASQLRRPRFELTGPLGMRLGRMSSLGGSGSPLGRRRLASPCVTDRVEATGRSIHEHHFMIRLSELVIGGLKAVPTISFRQRSCRTRIFNAAGSHGAPFCPAKPIPNTRDFEPFAWLVVLSSKIGR
jgi:hypothetical protein